MPIFLSEEEFERCRHDPAMVAERADQFIRGLHRQLETVRAESDAASIAAEHTCSLLEHRYEAVSADHTKLQAENARLATSFEQRLSELAEARAEKHNIHLKIIAKDGEIERLTVESSELHKSKRQLLDLVEQKDSEIGEKNATIQGFLEKIINLTDNAASKEAKLQENEADLSRCHAECARLTQEKELITKHNEWLNEEIAAKVSSLIELRKTHMNYEADMSAKLADVESKLSESSKKLVWREENVVELQAKLKSLEEEIFSCKDVAAATENRLVTELATVTKLIDLHKECSEEWSRKAGELEGVIKALETHLGQLENDYKEKLEKELSSKRELQKEVNDLRSKLDNCELELEKARKTSELSLLPLSSFGSDATAKGWIDENGDQGVSAHMIVPRIPPGVSGTALAASLLRDGWSLAKMYEKYQEAADALRHERWERRHSEAILGRVLHEIEEKAELILDERAQHDKMVEAYALMSQKLQDALSLHNGYENTIRTLKAELKRMERDQNIAQKEIVDLQKQVTVLLKECHDTQLRCGKATPANADDLFALVPFGNDGPDIEKSVSEHLVPFKDIHGLVEQNAQLHGLVHKFSDEEDKRQSELRDKFQFELQKVTEDAAARVEAVLRRSEEQGQMLESLHSSVAMYKRLYDEERRSRQVIPRSTEVAMEGNFTVGKDDLVRLADDYQEVIKKAREQLVEQIRSLEGELDRSRNDLATIRLERDKMALESKFAKEKLDSFMKEFDHQREQANAVSARNVELTQLLVDYQRKVREASEALLASEEHSRKTSMEVAVLEREKDILVNSEKKASEEVRNLSDRVHRLQSTLDAIQSADEVREEARRLDKMKSEEHLKHIEIEWAEAKTELQEERDHVRKLIAEREKILESSLSQVEGTRKQVADAWKAVTSAESRAAVAEARCLHLESKVKELKRMGVENGQEQSTFSDTTVVGDFWKMKEEMDKLKEEAQANKDYMLQYKEIAQTNDWALKNMESAHEEFKTESEKLKKALEEEVISLRGKMLELEKDYMTKSNEAFLAVETKEEALKFASLKIDQLKEENASNMAQIMEMEVKISALSKSLEEEHQRWRNAQNNYERQVVLQSEAIQEMTRTSQELAVLQEDISELRKLYDAQKSENELLRTKWEGEKAILEQSKNEAEKKYGEIDEQNKILHSRLETMHIKLAAMEHGSSGTSFRSGTSGSQGENDLQHVISYLRRSKEIAETEISLLKQEKLRLQSQLDSALKASETAQALLRTEREKVRASTFAEDEFKSLQLQLKEINLLRESNSQLREENKYNFEECQKFRETAQKAKVEAEQLDTQLRNKEREVEACQKEIESWKMEKARLESEIAELRENFKRISQLDYDRLKDEFQQAQVKLKERENELESVNSLVSKMQEDISHLQQELSKSKTEFEEQEKRMTDIRQTEAALRLDIEKQKKVASHFRKKLETVTKEREELNKENQSLQEQLEDFKSGKRATNDVMSEQAMKEKEKEKDTRIQMLEKTLDREREDLKKEREDNRKEKQKRQKMETTIVETLERVHQEKKKLEEEMEKHRQSISSVLESTGAGALQLPSNICLDEQAEAYFQAFNHFKETANSSLNERPGVLMLPSSAQSLDASADVHVAASAQQVVNQHRPLVSQQKVIEQRERKLTVPKSSVDARKRKLVRPSLEQSEEPSADVEMQEVEGSASTEKGKQGEFNEHETQNNIFLSASRKRAASLSISDLKDDPGVLPEDSSGSAPLKRPRAEEAQEGVAAQTDLPSDFLNLPPSSEHLYVAGAFEVLPPENETFDNAETSDSAVKEPIQPEELLGGEDAGIKNEFDASAEIYSEKTNETIATLDDFPVIEGLEGQDSQQTADLEEDREEGELVSDTPDQQLEGSESEMIRPEVFSGEGATVDGTTEVVEGLDMDPSDVVNEDRNDGGVDEVEGLEKSSEQANDNDPDQSPQIALGSSECSPSVFVETVPEKVYSSTVASCGGEEQQRTKGKPESGDKRSEKGGTEEVEQRTAKSTTIILTERAKERALMRQAGIGAQRSPLRGRGRAVAGFRRDSGRGTRGARGGRGQSSGDKEQG